MLRYIFKKLHFLQLLNQKLEEEEYPQKPPESDLSPDLEKNLNVLRGILGTSYDVKIREFALGDQGQINAALIFLEGMTVKATKIKRVKF